MTVIKKFQHFGNVKLVIQSSLPTFFSVLYLEHKLEFDSSQEMV